MSGAYLGSSRAQSNGGSSSMSTLTHPLPQNPSLSSNLALNIKGASGRPTNPPKRSSTSPIKAAHMETWKNPLDSGPAPSSSKGDIPTPKKKEIFLPSHDEYEPLRRPRSPRRYDGPSRHETYPRSPPPLRYEPSSSRRDRSREREKDESYLDRRDHGTSDHSRDYSRRGDRYEGGRYEDRRRSGGDGGYGTSRRHDDSYETRNDKGYDRYVPDSYDGGHDRDHGRSRTSGHEQDRGHRHGEDRRHRDEQHGSQSDRESRHKSPEHKRERRVDKSPPHQPSTPAMEEGEIDDDIPIPIRPRTPSDSPPPAPPIDSPNGTVSSNGNVNPYKPGRKLLMKNRPPNPVDSYRTNTPPPPPPDTPPPPPDDLPPPPDGSLSSYQPEVKDQAFRPRANQPSRPIPHAPNRNNLHPTTRVLTPPAKGELKVSVKAVPRHYKRPTEEEEKNNLNKNFVGTATLAAYDLGTKLGEGTFGVVTKAVEHASKRLVALKKLLTHNPRDGVSVTTVREIKILKSLHHPNVVPILDMVVQPKSTSDKSGRQEIFMVFPFMDHDLCGLLGNGAFKMRPSIAKLIMKQILEGMAYIHANNFIHRDIKTANILVDKRGGVMIADFGLARTWTRNPDMPKHMATEYTNMVVTRWYRAPELLLGDTHYGPAVDMWSLGCVLGEMYNRDPILPGGPNDDDQLRRIAAHCGPLNEQTFPGWSGLPGFPGMEGYEWDMHPAGIPIKESAQKWGLDEPGADLLVKLLTLDPTKRFTAEQALDHPWFWIAPKPALLEKTDLGVESSHEMTLRKKEVAAPPPHQQSYHHHKQQHQLHQQQRQQGGFRPNNGRPGWAGGGGGGGRGYQNGGAPNPNMGMNGGMNIGGGYGNAGPGPNMPMGGMGGPPMPPNMGGLPNMGMPPNMGGLPSHMGQGNGSGPNTQFNGPPQNYGRPPPARPYPAPSGPQAMHPRVPLPSFGLTQRAPAPPPTFKLASGGMPNRPPAYTGPPTGPHGGGGAQKRGPPGYPPKRDDKRRRGEEGEVPLNYG